MLDPVIVEFPDAQNHPHVRHKQVAQGITAIYIGKDLKQKKEKKRIES